jgi:hypothetical protein
MRKRPLLALAALLTTAVAAVSPAASVQAAPAGCSASASGIVLACDHSFPTARPMGAIGLLGDSVLLGSSPGMSNPHLPALLGTRQWGPIRMTTSLGMRTYNPVTTSASAFHVVGRWKAAGFNPRVIVVNLGANHFLDCSPTTFTTCQAKIVQLMDRIATQYPAATVWWAKTNARSLRTGAFDPGMLGWNKALDAVEKARPTKLVVWDWPKAIVDGRFVMDPPQIHPSNATQYVRRSTFIADDVTARMPARFAPSGTNVPVTPPVPPAGPLGFTVADPPVQTALIAVGGTPVRRAVGDVSAVAAALTITVHNAAAAGYVRAYDCDASTSVGTRLYFSAGQTRSVQAVSGLSGGEICLTARVTPVAAVNVTITTQGNFFQGSGSYLTPQATTNQQASFALDKVATVDVTNDVTVDAVAATLVVDATGVGAAGTLAVDACDQPADPSVVEIAYAKGEVVSGQAFAPVDASGQLCIRATTAATSLPKVFVRVTGGFSPGGLLAFRPVQTVRVFDLRPAPNLKGGFVGRRFPGQDIILPSLPGARAASLVVTSYESTARGANVLWQRGPKPPTALFYFPAGTAAASNTVTVPVATNGYAIGDTSATGIQRFAIDVAGWWVTAP